MKKGKIGIINHWMGNNYGVPLLSYALLKKTQELGYDAEMVSWLPDEVRHPWKVSMIKKTGLIHYILRLGYFSVFIMPRHFGFSRFRKKLKSGTKQYTDATFPEIANDYDKIIVGGDQMWNCKINYFNENNFLPFIKEKERKVVYAASLAQDNMREGFEDEFRRLASGFGYITTRERRAKEIIEEITGLQAPRVADSAFLMTAEEWSNVAEEVKAAKDQKYIFVYQVQQDKVVAKLAEKVAKEKGLKVIYCPFPLKKQISCIRKPYMSPEKWLYCVKNAEYVITDAFHGLVFAIIFNRKFAVEISAYGKDVHSRITNLLELFGLENRLFSKIEDIDIDAPIDYNRVNEIIAEDRENAMTHLKAMLEL